MCYLIDYGDQPFGFQSSVLQGLRMTGSIRAKALSEHQGVAVGGPSKRHLLCSSVALVRSQLK